jgi:hypothetical protein
MFRAWLIRLLGGHAPTKRSLSQAIASLDDRLEALESKSEKRAADFKELRGYVYAMKRGRPASQDDVGPLIPAGEDTQIPPPPHARPKSTTAHLSSRFKLGG